MIMTNKGSSVNEFAMGQDMDVRIRNIGIPDRFIEHGSIDELKKSLHLEPDAIAMQICAMCGKENEHE
jgi:1-deoxy-D-xylulose-5-phosphate synthase